MCSALGLVKFQVPSPQRVKKEKTSREGQWKDILVFIFTWVVCLWYNVINKKYLTHDSQVASNKGCHSIQCKFKINQENCKVISLDTLRVGMS